MIILSKVLIIWCRVWVHPNKTRVEKRQPLVVLPTHTACSDGVRPHFGWVGWREDGLEGTKDFEVFNHLRVDGDVEEDQLFHCVDIGQLLEQMFLRWGGRGGGGIPDGIWVP